MRVRCIYCIKYVKWQRFKTGKQLILVILMTSNTIVSTAVQFYGICRSITFIDLDKVFILMHLSQAIYKGFSASISAPLLLF